MVVMGLGLPEVVMLLAVIVIKVIPYIFSPFWLRWL